jgi:hypothetical protein
MRRKAVGLSSSLERGPKMYTLAASAAGVGVLALAQAAEAEGMYTRAGESLGAKIGQVYHIALDLNHSLSAYP